MKVPTKELEELEAEIQDIRRVAHANAHIITRTSTKGCSECARLEKENNDTSDKNGKEKPWLWRVLKDAKESYAKWPEWAKRSSKS